VRTTAGLSPRLSGHGDPSPEERKSSPRRRTYRVAVGCQSTRLCRVRGPTAGSWWSKNRLSPGIEASDLGHVGGGELRSARRVIGDGRAEPSRLRGLAGWVVQGRAQIPGPAPERLTRQHLRVVIAHHDHLLLSARSIPTTALLTGTSPRSRASLALRLRSPRDTPLRLATNVLLLRWDTKPAAHQEDVPTPRTDTQNVFLCRRSLADPAVVQGDAWHCA
jgi:hypothetical protein